MATSFQQQFDLDMLNARNTWGFEGDGTRRSQAKVGVEWANQKLEEWIGKANHEIDKQGGSFGVGISSLVDPSKDAWLKEIRDSIEEARNRIPIAIAAANFLGYQTLISSTPFVQPLGALAHALDGLSGNVQVYGESPYWTAFKSIPQAIADSAADLGNSIPKIGLLIGLAVAGVVAWKVFK